MQKKEIVETPLMKQYNQIKTKYPGAILLFRVGDFYETFGEDVVKNLKRIKNGQVYEDLVDASISVTEKFGWQKDQETIVAFILKDNRIKKPEGKLQKVIQSYTLSNSKKAFH